VDEYDTPPPRYEFDLIREQIKDGKDLGGMKNRIDMLEIAGDKRMMLYMVLARELDP